MADEMSMALDELVRKVQLSDEVDFLWEGVRTLAHALMEAEVAQHLRAGRYERTAERTGERNGHREGAGTRGWAALRCGCPACGMVAIFRRCWSRGGRRSRRMVQMSLPSLYCWQGIHVYAPRPAAASGTRGSEHEAARAR